MVTSQNSYSQNKFDELYNKMFFNIFTPQPDTVVTVFLQNYFPYLLKRTDKIRYKISAPDTNIISNDAIHTFIFYQCPFFEFKFEEGHLEILTSEAKGFLPRIKQSNLRFVFENKSDAENALKVMMLKFDQVSTQKKMIRKGGKKIVLYTDQPLLKNTNCIQFILMRDELYDKKYKILFSFGSFTFSNEYYGF